MADGLQAPRTTRVTSLWTMPPGEAFPPLDKQRLSVRTPPILLCSCLGTEEEEATRGYDPSG